MTKTIELPSREALLALFKYDPDSGDLRWRVSRGRARVGQIAGSIRAEDGYRRIKVNEVMYYAHRAIWMMQTGEDPGEMQIDHRNMDTRDNSWENLRLASHSENKRNGRGYAGTSSPFCGVSWHKGKKVWFARIRVDTKLTHLGTYHCMVEAARAYDDAARRMHGEFAKLNFPDETGEKA